MERRRSGRIKEIVQVRKKQEVKTSIVISSFDDGGGQLSKR